MSNKCPPAARFPVGSGPAKGPTLNVRFSMPGDTVPPSCLIDVGPKSNRRRLRVVVSFLALALTDHPKGVNVWADCFDEMTQCHRKLEEFFE